MRKVYAVKQLSGLGEAVAVCESYDEAVFLAEKIAYIDEEKGQTAGDFVFELPFISAERAIDNAPENQIGGNTWRTQ